MVNQKLTISGLVVEYKAFKQPAVELEWMNVSLLRNNHRHVSAIYVAIFWVARTRIKLQIKCVDSFRHIIIVVIFLFSPP